eukprot:g4343.t1
MWSDTILAKFIKEKHDSKKSPEAGMRGIDKTPKIEETPRWNPAKGMRRSMGTRGDPEQKRRDETEAASKSTVEESVSDEIEAREIAEKWMNFAKVDKTGCDTFPFCNHIPAPPPLMPNPVDLDEGMGRLTMPYTPPKNFEAPPQSWNVSRVPFEVINNEQMLKSGKRVQPSFYASFTHENQADRLRYGDNKADAALGRHFDIGQQLSEFEKRPFGKNGQKWGQNFHMYRNALGLLADSREEKQYKSAEAPYNLGVGPADMTEDTINQNWQELRGNGEYFDVFDAATEETVKGRVPTDPDDLETAVGDIPDAPSPQNDLNPLTEADWFMGDARRAANKESISVELMREVKRSGRNSPLPFLMRRFGFVADCRSIPDLEEKAFCFKQRQASIAKVSQMDNAPVRFRSSEVSFSDRKPEFRRSDREKGLTPF